MSAYSERLRRERREELALRALAVNPNDNQPEEAVVACGDVPHEGVTAFEMDGDDGVLYELSEHHEEILNLLENYEASSPEVQSFINATIKAVEDAEDKLDSLIKDDDEDEDNMDHEGGLSYASLEGETEEFATCAAARKRVAKARRSLRRAVRSLRTCSGGIIVRRFPVPVSAPTPTPPPAPAPAMQVEVSVDWTSVLEDISESDFAALPPFLKDGIVKGLKKKLAAEKDPEKKAEIQAKIDKLEE